MNFYTTSTFRESKGLEELDQNASLSVDIIAHRNHRNHRKVLKAHTDLNHLTDFMTDNELTYEIRGAVWDVYNALGPGLLESVYEEALVFELQQRGLKVERQKQVPIVYKGNVLKTDLRLDIIVNDQVIIELKSVEEMKPVFFKQTKTYLKLLGKKLGLLVNFGEYDMKDGIHRIIL
jgi:GxxExxY protein